MWCQAYRASLSPRVISLRGLGKHESCRSQIFSKSTWKKPLHAVHLGRPARTASFEILVLIVHKNSSWKIWVHDEISFNKSKLNNMALFYHNKRLMASLDCAFGVVLMGSLLHCFALCCCWHLSAHFSNRSQSRARGARWMPAAHANRHRGSADKSHHRLWGTPVGFAI